jgi:hypothetical protein
MTFKRGKTYWYKFYWSVKHADGRSESFLIRKSARTSNQRRAHEMQEEHRRALRLGEIHPLDPWPTVPNQAAPTLSGFATRFSEHNSIHVKASSNVYYEVCTKRLLSFRDLAAAPLSKINGDLVSRYAKWRTSAGISISTINGDLRTVRRMLRLAFEWGLIERIPVLHELLANRGVHA